jgi:hypothetical protein
MTPSLTAQNLRSSPALVDHTWLTRRYASLSQHSPRVPWDVFSREVFFWKPGEHVGLIGPTGQGKTTMLVSMLPRHPYVTVFATKPRDDTMQFLEARKGYLKLKRWKSIDPRQYPRRVLWPDATKLYSASLQQEIFGEAMDKIYREGEWTVGIDELWYFINTLRLEHEVKTYLLQARSLGISLLAGTQRPAFVPLEVYDQSSHLFLWRDSDRRNLDRLSDLSAPNSYLLRDLVTNLDRHQVLYVNTRTGEMVRTHCPKVAGMK